MNSTRRTFLATGAAAVAAATAPHTFSQQNPEQKQKNMSFYEKGNVRIHYEEAGSGHPLLIIPGGNLNSTISFLSSNAPFNPMDEFSDKYHCITMDLRNADGGHSSGPLVIDRPWDAYTDDQLGLMDHLGIDKFMVLGFCIGGPFIWNLLEKAPERISAAVLAQPSGFSTEEPDFYYQANANRWAPPSTFKTPRNHDGND